MYMICPAVSEGSSVRMKARISEYPRKPLPLQSCSWNTTSSGRSPLSTRSCSNAKNPATSMVSSSARSLNVSGVPPCCGGSGSSAASVVPSPIARARHSTGRLTDPCPSVSSSKRRESSASSSSAGASGTRSWSISRTTLGSSSAASPSRSHCRNALAAASWPLSRTRIASLSSASAPSSPPPHRSRGAAASAPMASLNCKYVSRPCGTVSSAASPCSPSLCTPSIAHR
eukprot:scaffold1744_cov340-Prasinococcus_capsulatus_cf.AAC.12